MKENETNEQTPRPDEDLYFKLSKVKHMMPIVMSQPALEPSRKQRQWRKRDGGELTSLFLCALCGRVSACADASSGRRCLGGHLHFVDCCAVGGVMWREGGMEGWRRFVPPRPSGPTR